MAAYKTTDYDAVTIRRWFEARPDRRQVSVNHLARDSGLAPSRSRFDLLNAARAMESEPGSPWDTFYCPERGYMIRKGIR